MATKLTARELHDMANDLQQQCLEFAMRTTLAQWQKNWPDKPDEYSGIYKWRVQPRVMMLCFDKQDLITCAVARGTTDNTNMLNHRLEILWNYDNGRPYFMLAWNGAEYAKVERIVKSVSKKRRYLKYDPIKQLYVPFSI